MIRQRSRCAPPGRVLHLESLEDRRLLSATTIELPNVTVGTSSASDHILVRFRDDAKPVALTGTTLGQAHDLVANLYDIELSASVSVDQALAAYRQDRDVDYAETDANLGVVWTPNDPQFALQWDMKNNSQLGADISATNAWNITINARRIPIAEFDTGIDYTHPDLYRNIWINPGEIPASRLKNLIDVDSDKIITMNDLNDPRNQGVGKITDLNGNGYIDGGDLLKPMTKDAKGVDTGKGGWADGISNNGDKYIDDIIGWNSNANNNNPMDGYGHGTHVAGTMGAMSSNGKGVAGVVWDAQIVPVKFFDDNGNGTVSQFIDGLNWALAQGIKLSNNSWTDGGYTPALYEAIKVAQAKGHLLVIAAGNNARNTDSQPVYPADFNLDNIVSVGASDRYNQLASFSNFGVNSVDIVAPGVDILSTNPNGQYGYRSGTSMATPHVTGVAALVWALRPEWTYKQVIDQLLRSADRMPSLTGKVASGLLDAYAAVKVPPRVATTAIVATAGQTTTTTAGSSGGVLHAASFESAPPMTLIAAPLSPLSTTGAPAHAVEIFLGPSVTTSSSIALASNVPPAELYYDNGMLLGLAADLFGYRLVRPSDLAPLHSAGPMEEGEE